jgi:hypothetical protein
LHWEKPWRKRLGALRQAQDKLQMDKAAMIVLVDGFWLIVDRSLINVNI